MGTMRHDRTSLWGDPRISAAEILDALKEEERRSLHPAKWARPFSRSVPFSLAGGAFVAALGFKVFGLDRAAKLVAWIVPPLLMLGIYEGLSRSRVVEKRVV